MGVPRGTWPTIPLTAFVLHSLLYLPVFFLIGPGGGLGLANSAYGWYITTWMLYLAVVGALGLWMWLASGERMSGAAVSFGPFVPARWLRRTGVSGTDWLVCICFVLLAVAFLHSSFWLPWSSLGAVVFLVTGIFLRTEPWPVHPSRDIPDLPPSPPPQTGEDVVARSWSWDARARGSRMTLMLRIRTAQASSRGRENPSQLGVTTGNIEQLVHRIVNDGAQDWEAVEAARQLLAVARNLRFNYFEEAQNTLQFVQVIPYGTDKDTKGLEYFRYAIETLMDDVGDCDCKAILAASLFRLMGLRSVVLISNQEEHAAVAVEGAPDFPGNRYFVWKGARYYFCETTDSSFGFTVGEVPPSMNLDNYTQRIEIDPQLLAGGA